MPLSGPAGQSVMETGMPLWTPMPERLTRLASVFCHRSARRTRYQLLPPRSEVCTSATNCSNRSADRRPLSPRS